MFLLQSRPGAYVLVIALLIFLLYRGILPAMTRVESDFPNYYTAAKIVADGKDVRRMYDDTWFQSEMAGYGFDMQGKFSPFPPVTALVYLPLSAFDPLTALRITTVINLAIVIATIRFLAPFLSLSLIESSLFILLSGIGLANCLRLGQLYIVLSFMIVLGYALYTTKKPIAAGICFGLLTPIKYYPFIFLAYFAFKKEWKLVISGVAAALLVALIGIGVLGWEIHREYFASVLGNHLASHFSHQNSFSATFQSWDSLLRRLLVFDAILNPDPLFTANSVFPIVKIILLVGQLVAGVIAIARIHQLKMENPDALSIGVLGILALLLAPGTATYHYVLLWLPVGLLLGYFLENSRKATYVLLGLYGMVGLIPYGATRQFDGKGLVTLLAYPRLGAMVVMFLMTLYLVWNRTAQLSVTK